MAGRREMRGVVVTQASADQGNNRSRAGVLSQVILNQRFSQGQAGWPLTVVGQLAIRGGCGFCDRRGQWKKIR
jgi:hypothetical protein